MILAQNKNVLNYLFKAIEHRRIATVGYYIGGMKEEQLKQSENKKIIVATYAMAEEGLDIKTLTTLIMATPKVDVRQSVGRILRQKHEDIIPKIIDIVDNFSCQYFGFIKRTTSNSTKVCMTPVDVNDNATVPLKDFKITLSC